MHRNRLVVAAAALVGLAGTAIAALPDYDFQIYARTNFAVNPGGALNLPPNYFFSGEDIAINDHRNIAFRLTVTTGKHKAVWYGNPENGGLAYFSEDDASLSAVSINNSNMVVWAESFNSAPGVYYLDPETFSSGFLTNQPLGVTTISGIAINDDGLLGFRGQFGFAGTALVSVDPTVEGAHTWLQHAADSSLNPSSAYSYFFTPSFNNHRDIATSVRYGPGVGNSNPDEIRIFKPDGTSVLIAQDRDANPESPYASFDNSPRINNKGQVAFIATLVGGGRGVFVSDGATTTTIATTHMPEVNEIESFSPDINDHGLVVFRGRNSDNIRSIFVGDGQDLKVVVKRYDILPSDLGPAWVNQEVVSSPAFGGSPRINNNGDIAFNCGLTPPDNDQIEWGTAVYVAIAKPATPAECLGDLSGDGQINADDLGILLSAFGSSDAGDLNDDGVTDADDLGVLLSLLGTSCD
jgi:hypothetical protein